MSEPTIIALAMLFFVFCLMAIALFKLGIEAAVKMWSVMGALTGVAFGGITTYYFADQTYKEQIAQLETENSSFQQALASVNTTAIEAKKFVAPFAATLRGENGISVTYPIAASYANSLPQEERIKLLMKFTETTNKLAEIETISKQ